MKPIGTDSGDAIILPLQAPQPSPCRTYSVRHETGGKIVTAVGRGWLRNDRPAVNCRLCPKGDCVVDDDNFCLLVVDGFVSKKDAPLLNTVNYISAPGGRRLGLGSVASDPKIATV